MLLPQAAPLTNANGNDANVASETNEEALSTASSSSERNMSVGKEMTKSSWKRSMIRIERGMKGAARALGARVQSAADSLSVRNPSGGNDTMRLLLRRKEGVTERVKEVGRVCWMKVRGRGREGIEGMMGTGGMRWIRIVLWKADRKEGAHI